MMTVTHGIVGVKAPNFLLEVAVLAIGDNMNIRLYGPINSTVNIDYGDGLITIVTLDVSPKSVAGTTTGLSLIFSSTSLERFEFLTTSRPRIINLINGRSLTSLQTFAGSNSYPIEINIRNAPNAFNWSGICFNLSNLSSFTVDDSSMVTDMTNAFNGSNFTELPPTVTYESALSLNLAYAGNNSMVDAGILNAPVCTDFSSVIFNSANIESLTIISPLGELFNLAVSECPNLSCLGAINTTNQTDTTDLFLNTPLLINPTPAEQTAILAGSNYVNASPCP